MEKLFLFLFFLCLWSIVSASNVLINGDFADQTTNGRYAYPDNKAKLTVIPAGKVGYGASLTQKTQTYQGIGQTIYQKDNPSLQKVTIGKKYLYSAWVYHTSTTKQKMSLMIRTKQGSIQQIHFISSSSFVPGNVWVRMQGLYTITGTPDSVDFFIQGNGTDEIRVDEVRIEPLASITSYTPPTTSNPKAFIRAKGRDLVLGCDDTPILIKGVNLVTPTDDTDGETIIWQQQAFIEEDFQKIKAMGFNAVRLMITARMFQDCTETADEYRSTVIVKDQTTCKEKDNPIEGFAYIDRVVQWAKANNIFVLLDMHAPHGGYQSDDIYTVQTPLFWGNPPNWTSYQIKTANVRKKIAQRYAHEPTIMGYDLINEPVVLYNKQWIEYATYLIDTIRSVDTNHLINVQMAFKSKANDVALVPFADTNILYDVHTYYPREYTIQYSSQYGKANQRRGAYVPQSTMTGYAKPGFGFTSLEQGFLTYDVGVQSLIDKGLPINIGEYGVVYEAVALDGTPNDVGALAWIRDNNTLFDTYKVNRFYFSYSASPFGICFGDSRISPLECNQHLIQQFKTINGTTILPKETCTSSTPPSSTSISSQTTPSLPSSQESSFSLQDALFISSYFADDFSRENPSQWIKGNRSFNESDTQFIPNNVQFTNGTMMLKIEKDITDAVSGKGYLGAQYQTIRDDFSYGVYEVRMQRAPGTGIISSFFTFRDGNLSQARHEIDIEFLRGNNEVQFNYIDKPGNVTAYSHTVVLPYDASKHMETYQIEYMPTYIRFYHNGTRIGKQITASSLSNITTMPNKKGMKIMMNVRVPIPSLWHRSGNPSATHFPQYAIYDYVKYYPTFGDISLGTSALKGIFIKNISSNNILLTFNITGGCYTLAKTDCATLLPGSSCQVYIKFTPTKTGLHTGELLLSSLENSSFIKIPLRGHGTYGQILPQDVVQTTSFEKANNQTAIGNTQVVGNTDEKIPTHSGIFPGTHTQTTSEKILDIMNVSSSQIATLDTQKITKGINKKRTARPYIVTIYPKKGVPTTYIKNISFVFSDRIDLHSRGNIVIAPFGSSKNIIHTCKKTRQTISTHKGKKVSKLLLSGCGFQTGLSYEIKISGFANFSGISMVPYNKKILQ